MKYTLPLLFILGLAGCDTPLFNPSSSANEVELKKIELSRSMSEKSFELQKQMSEKAFQICKDKGFLPVWNGMTITCQQFPK